MNILTNYRLKTIIYHRMSIVYSFLEYHPSKVSQRSICQSFQSRLREMSSRPDWTRQTPLFLNRETGSAALVRRSLSRIDFHKFNTSDPHPSSQSTTGLAAHWQCLQHQWVDSCHPFLTIYNQSNWYTTPQDLLDSVCVSCTLTNWHLKHLPVLHHS